jgi:ferredoxin
MSSRINMSSRNPLNKMPILSHKSKEVDNDDGDDLDFTYMYVVNLCAVCARHQETKIVHERFLQSACLESFPASCHAMHEFFFNLFYFQFRLAIS